MSASKDSTPIVFEWLERIGLGYAVPHFKERGIVNPKALTALNIKDYEDLHVSDLGDRKRLYELVQRVRLASKSVKQRKPANASAGASKPGGDGKSSAATESSAATARKIVDANAASSSSATKKSAEAAAPTKKMAVKNESSSIKSSGSTASKSTTSRAPGRHSTGGESAREMLRRKRAKERVRRLTQSPATGEERGSEVNASDGSANTNRRGNANTRSTTSLLRPSTRVKTVRAPVTDGSGSANRGSRPKSNDSGRRRGNRYARPAEPEVPEQAPASDVRLSSSQAFASVRGTAADILSLDPDEAARTMAAKIRVVVRKRPLSRKERSRDDLDIVDMDDDQHVYLHEPRVKVDMTRYVETHDFAFDHAFDESQNNEVIYRHTCRPLVSSVFERSAKATVFAYGQTGSGKTHTMMGPDKGKDEEVQGKLRVEKGLYEMAAEDIFMLNKSERYKHINVSVSFFEIYGGRLFDLLNERRKLRCLEDHEKKVQIVGIREQPIANTRELFEVMEIGHACRSVGTTGANLDSSRSHAVLQFILKDNRTGKKTGGKFSFVDLAGSERGADTTHNNRQTRMEGAEINKSLLALKECIRALFHVQNHTPFRGSKLTQVLKDSFVGGNSHTVMVVTISPNLTNAEHTLNTLRYGYRVKEIKNDATVGRGRNRNAMKMDLNRDYGDKSRSSVRRSAPSGPLRKAFQYGENGRQQSSSRDSGASARPTTADSGRQTRHPRQAQLQHQQKNTHRATPPQRHSHQVSSGGTNPPAPQAGGGPSTLTPQVRGPPLPESTPSPDALPVPTPSSTSGKRHSASSASRSGERHFPGRKRLNMNPLRTSKEARLEGAAADRAEAAELEKKTKRRDSGKITHDDVPLVIESLVGEDEVPKSGSLSSTADEPMSPAVVAEMEEEHAELVTDIINDQEGLVAAHREQIHEMMNLVKQEMTALDEVEAAGASVDDYVESLENILASKASIVSKLRRQLDEFKAKLEVEEELSASIGSSRNCSPASKRSPISSASTEQSVK